MVYTKNNLLSWFLIELDGTRDGQIAELSQLIEQHTRLKLVDFEIRHGAGQTPNMVSITVSAEGDRSQGVHLGALIRERGFTVVHQVNDVIPEDIN